jgi:hypothetical protein
VVDLLIAAVRADPPHPHAAITDRSVDEILDIADAHRVTPALLRYLSGLADPPAQLLEAVRPWRTEQVLRHLTTLADLAPVAAAFDAAAIRWVVVKGPVAAATLWPSADMRDYKDLDVIVDPGRLGDAIELLDGLGAEQLDVNWGLIRRQMRAELSFVLPRGTLLDLHWHPVNDTRLRRALRWDVGELLARRRTVRVGSLGIPALDPADSAVHLAYHAVHSGGHRLLWLADVAYGLAAADPAVVAARAEAARLGLLVQVAADRVDRVIGPTPTLPWTSARGNAWRTAMAAVDARAEVPRPGLSGHSGKTRVGSTRPTTAASVLELLAASLGHVVHRRGAADRVLPDNPLYVPDGDLGARREYLAAVAREG